MVSLKAHSTGILIFDISTLKSVCAWFAAFFQPVSKTSSIIPYIFKGRHRYSIHIQVSDYSLATSVFRVALEVFSNSMEASASSLCFLRATIV